MYSFWIGSLFSLLFLPCAQAEVSCHSIFKLSWSAAETAVNNLNRSKILSDIVLLSRTPLQQSILKGDVSAVGTLLKNDQKNSLVSSFYFDEIALAIALHQNFIAEKILTASQIGSRYFYLRRDLVLVALLSHNVDFYRYLQNQWNMRLSKREKDDLIHWLLYHPQDSSAVGEL